MREITVIVAAVTIVAAALGGCAHSSGPFASAASPAPLVMVDRFHGEMRKCGPDRHVCFEMQRDDTDRQHGN
jgi:hypothetical protein